MPRLSLAATAAALTSLLSVGACLPAMASAPASGPAVLGLQIALRDAGAKVPLSARLGPVTANAAQALRLNPNAPLRTGDAGPAVTALQHALTAAGYPVEATGRFGPLTTALVIRFQQAHGRPPNGTVDLNEVVRATALYTIMGYADGLLGSRYTWGGADPESGFDCSGLVSWIYSRVGIDLTHSTYAQWHAGTPVPAGELRPGDLVFFSTFAPGPSHVGIYIGNDEFIHAANPAAGVTLDSLRSPYWFDHYVGARRILSTNAD